MRNIDNKIQAYIDGETKAFLTQQAEEKSVSLSRYASQILQDHVANAANERVYKARILTILAQILSCVYDKETFQSNAKQVQELLDLIHEDCKKRYE